MDSGLHILILLAAVLAVVVIAAIICVTCDRVERRWRLSRLRARMAGEPDLSDAAFAAMLSDLPSADVIEMRHLLASVLHIDPVKIRPEWRFMEERHIKYPDRGAGAVTFIPFAARYAPDQLRGRIFRFPLGKVETVSDLMREAVDLKHDRRGDAYLTPPSPKGNALPDASVTPDARA